MFNTTKSIPLSSVLFSLAFSSYPLNDGVIKMIPSSCYFMDVPQDDTLTVSPVNPYPFNPLIALCAMPSRYALCSLKKPSPAPQRLERPKRVLPIGAK